MTRARWTADELRDHDLVTIVDLTFAGQVLRLATRAVDVADGDVEHAYPATLRPVTYSRSVALFDNSPEVTPVVIEGFVQLDLSTWILRGYRLEGCPVEVSQVRVNRRGVAVDSYAKRKVLVRGAVRDAQWGAYGNGHSEIRFSAELAWFALRTKVPGPSQAVKHGTSPVTGWVGASDIGIAYPVLFGYPGRDRLHSDGWVPAYRAPWWRKWKNYHVLVAGLGRRASTTVRISTSEDPVGVEVTLRQEYSANGSTAEARDIRGNLVSVVDLDLDGVEEDDGAAFIGDSYVPAVDESADVWVAFPYDAGAAPDPLVIRDAGDVLRYLLDASGIPYDVDAFAVTAQAVSWLKLDFAITQPVDPFDFIQEEIIPLLPVGILFGGNGLTFPVWRTGQSTADTVAVIDADSDPEIVAANLANEDSSEVANLITLRYGWDDRAQSYRYTSTIGPEFEASTDVARGEIRSTATGSTYESVALLTTDASGNGIRVIVTTGAVELASYDPAGRVLTVTVKTSTSTSASLSSTINASAFPGVSQPRGDASTPWYGVTTSAITLSICEFGTAPSEACRRSRDRLAEADRPGPGAGIRAKEVETSLVMEPDVAARVLEWMAAAYALPIVRLSVTGPARRYGHLEPGDPVLLTSSEHGLVGVVATVEQADDYGDGTVGLRMAVAGA